MVIVLVGMAVGVIITLNVVIILFSGKQVPTPEIPRNITEIGSGKELNMLVLGDSTAVTQGADYSDGYVVQIAEGLSSAYRVRYKNVAVSGATIVDVAKKQLDEIEQFTPDIAIVAAGANDVTRLTSLSSIERSLYEIINTLQTVNPEIRIFFTGAAAMDTIQRFPQPTRWFIGLRTNQINDVFREKLVQERVIFVDIAKKTRATFSNRPDLLAEDNFHPNAAGYAEWTKVLLPVVQDALASQ